MKRETQARFSGLMAVGVVGVLLVLVTPATGVAQSDSPFLPPGFGEKEKPPPPPSVLDKIEFRGVLTIGETTLVTLFDTSTSKSFTVELGQTANGIQVTDYQMTEKSDSVVIAQGGKSKRIELRKPKIVAMAAQPTAKPATAAAGQPQAPAAAPAAANSGITQMSDQEVRLRMQRVAEEIRRRRAMRRQALENSQQRTQ